MPNSLDNKTPLDLDLYRMMRLIRCTEEILMEEYHPADEMRCPIHFCVGQEAAAAALSLILRTDDVIFSHHRSHGYYLAKGAPLEDMVAEFYGRETGANGGLAGSQELSHPTYGFYSGTVLSGAFALAAGSAFAAQYRGSDAVAVGIIGDGGMEEGIVFETMNLAAVKKLPVLFLCENNGYSIHTPLAERWTSPHHVDQAKAFGVPAMLLDGNDARVLHEKLSGAVQDIRSGAGPVFAEVLTYRQCGHVGPEDDDHYGYRPQAELLEWMERDPVVLMRGELATAGGLADALDKIDHEVDAAVRAAVEAAKAAPFPDYGKAISANAPDHYAPVVTDFIEDPVADFDHTQQETRLEPY